MTDLTHGGLDEAALGRPGPERGRRTAVARVPGSKSITARALFLAAAADGTSTIHHPLTSADTTAFHNALGSLGFDAHRETSDAWTVLGDPAGPPATSAEVWCQDSGTAARFLPALAALGHGNYVIDAAEQMRRRPMSPLLEALRELGVEVESAPGDRLPLRIIGRGVRGGDVAIDAGVSSQYLTALCLMAPATDRGLRIRVDGIVSEPYVDMTLAMMKSFGAETAKEDSTVVIEPTGYRARPFEVEPDASAASYFFAAAAVTGTTVTVPGLGTQSLQGDLRFATEVLAAMGCTVEVTETKTTVTGPAQLVSPGEVVMRDISDTMMTLAAIAPFADAPVRIVDVANCRVKESDRIAAITQALGACGIATDQGPDWLEIRPGDPKPATVATHADHRIAMSMSVLGLRVPGLVLDDPGCVAKTYPGFHHDFAELRATWGLSVGEGT